MDKERGRRIKDTSSIAWKHGRKEVVKKQ